MPTQTITALYDDYDDASKAVAKLEAAGIPHADISLVANNDTRTGASADASRSDTAEHAETGAGTGATLGTVLGGGAGLLAGLGLLAIPGVGPVVAAGWLVATLTGAGIGAAAGGLAGSLTGAGLSEADAHTYAEGVRRGGTLLTVRADDAHAVRVMDILEEHGSVDIDERQKSWSQDGWTAPSAGTTTVGTGSTQGAALHAAGATGTAAAKTASATDSIPIVEEQLNVGKRATENGRVRVRSYASETPVTEQVTLRDETVQIDRQAVDRPLTTADTALFQNKTIEATEHTEVPVVSKEARVVEEIGLRKDAVQRTETVTDKVRRTEVEIEDERGNVTRTGTPNPVR